MENKIADMLIISTNDSAYTQPLSVADFNRTHVDLTYTNIEGGADTSGVTVTPQYSTDLQVWDDDTATNGTTVNTLGTGTALPPIRVSDDFAGPKQTMGGYRYMRLKIKNPSTSKRVMVSASVMTFNVDS